MLLLIIISCVIFQTAVTIYLFNINRTGDSFEKNLTRILVVLLVHLSAKFLLLGALKNETEYGQLTSGFGLAYGPLLYVLVCAFAGKALPRRRALLHLAPFFAASSIYLAIIAGGLSKIISNSFVIHYTTYFQWVVVASLVTYSMLVKKLLAYIRDNDAMGSGVEKAKWKLLNNISTVLATGILVGIFFELTNTIQSPIPNFHLRVLPYMCFAVIPVLILRFKLEGWVGKLIDNGPEDGKTAILGINAQPIIIPEVVGNGATAAATTVSNTKRYEKSSLDALTMDGYEQALRKYVETSKVFLTPELSLEELAHQVKIPKHHLTQLLNDRLGKNFYNYINEYRVQEAIIRLRNMHEDVNILSLAYDCGFNSKSSFNNYFKKVTQHTPSSYRKMVESSGQSSSEITA